MVRPEKGIEADKETMYLIERALLKKMSTKIRLHYPGSILAVQIKKYRRLFGSMLWA